MAAYSGYRLNIDLPSNYGWLVRRHWRSQDVLGWEGVRRFSLPKPSTCSPGIWISAGSVSRRTGRPVWLRRSLYGWSLICFPLSKCFQILLPRCSQISVGPTKGPTLKRDGLKLTRDVQLYCNFNFQKFRTHFIKIEIDKLRV